MQVILQLGGHDYLCQKLVRYPSKQHHSNLHPVKFIAEILSVYQNPLSKKIKIKYTIDQGIHFLIKNNKDYTKKY